MHQSMVINSQTIQTIYVPVSILLFSLASNLQLNSSMYFIVFYPFVSTAEDHVDYLIGSEYENGLELNVENNVDAPIEIVDSSDEGDGEDSETEPIIDNNNSRMELSHGAENSNDENISKDDSNNENDKSM